MAKQRCKTCGEWFDDSIFDIHLQEHLQEPAREEKERPPPELKCPFCNGSEFERETGFVKKSFAFGGHNIVMAICRQCHFIMQFYEGKTIFGVWGERKSNYSDIRDMLDKQK